ncbi:MAG: PQQ-dependent sugar dehydrogenase [Actinomycetota bacterium]|nr:PQQ-dependent sugar dehydrogenase [Actinomycetota bacterium]
MRRVLLATALFVLSTACSGGGGGQRTATTSTASPASSSPDGPVKVKLTELGRFDQPVAMAVRAGDDALYVAEKAGRVRKVLGGVVRPSPLLDLSDRVSTGTEQGLLGLAWAPDGRTFVVNYTDRDGHTHVVEYTAGEGTVPADSGRELLFVEQPFANHNGGQVLFGPDGMLWIGLGDGGSGGDPQGNAQHLGRLLGKLLRIDVRPSGGRPYTIPPDNPFVGRAGARGEIWSYGLRNPWRFTFDRGTGDLWIGDVGQNEWEEVNVARAGSKGGENWGWPAQEGKHPFRDRKPTPGAIEPVHEYSLSGQACAVTGGYVYRGKRLPGLVGQYVFADACVGEVRALAPSGEERSLDVKAGFVASFGEDRDGELYVLSLEGPLLRLDPA